MIQKRFERVSPESVGIRSADVLQLLNKLSLLPAGQEPHHFMLLRHGKVAAEGHWAPFAADMPHNLASVSKTLTSTAVGFAVQEGLLSLEDKVVDLMPDKLPEELQPEMHQMTVKILLEMGAGQECGDAHGGIKGEKRLKWQAKRKEQQETEKDEAKLFFTTPLIYEPGTIFGYNGMCSYLLALLVTRKTGMDMMEYLTPRLFAPLGIPTPYAQRKEDGTCIGAGGVFLSVEELAALGQFYLQKGKWNGVQLLNEAWMTEATKKHLPTKSEVGEDWSQGYCWQFWRGRHNTYRFCGAFGQMCVCMPDLDALFVIESGVDVDYMHNALDAFYDTVLAGMQAEPLPEEPETLALLQSRCAALSLAAPTSAPAAGAAVLAGEWAFEEDCPVAAAKIALEGAEPSAVLTMKNAQTLTFKPGAAPIGIPNTAGAPDDWAVTAWSEEIGTLCFRAWELTGFGRIDLRFTIAEDKLALQYHLRRSFGGETDDRVWMSK